MFSTIVLGVDDPKHSSNPTKYAIELAKHCRSKIILIHAVDFSSFKNVVATPREIAKRVYDKIMEEAQRYLDTAEALCKENGIECVKVRKIGHPVDEIIKIAEESGAGFIVLGSKGRSGLGGSIFGSVSYGVLHRDKTIPVFVVKN
jgi:nucleotide-binding universal stress UspA family protein